MSRARTLLEKAEDAKRLFEQRGHKVSGVTFKGREFSIDFAAGDAQEIPEADLVDMSK